MQTGYQDDEKHLKSGIDDKRLRNSDYLNPVGIEDFNKDSDTKRFCGVDYRNTDRKGHFDMKSDGETNRTVECINTLGSEHSDMKRNGKTCRNNIHIDTVGKDYFDKKSDDGTNRRVVYINSVDKENLDSTRDNEMNQDANCIKKGHHEVHKDAGNVKSAQGCNKNCHNSTTEFHIDASECILSAHTLETTASEIKLPQSPDRTEYKGMDDHNTLIENESDIHPEAKSVNSWGKADANKYNLKQIPAKTKTMRYKGSSSKQKDSDLRSLQEIKDDFKKTIIDLIDVYESNPGLQRIEKKDKRLLKRRKVLTKNNTLKPLPIVRGNLRIRRKQCFTIKPLPPKMMRLSNGLNTPKYGIQRRQKLEKEIQNNNDNIRETDDVLEKLKRTKTQNRFKKSEFELLPSSMNILSDAASHSFTRSGTSSDACTTTISVAELSSKTDEDIPQRLSTGRVSKARTSVKVFLKPEEPKTTSPGLECDSKETIRSKRIQSLYSTISRSKTGETALLKPLTITAKLELLEVESDDEELAF